jgi:hypothetical protein
MNQELTNMVIEAGITMSSQYGVQWEANTEDLEAFAKLVAAAEREKVAKQWEQWHGFDKHTVAAFIRAGGVTK